MQLLAKSEEKVDKYVVKMEDISDSELSLAMDDYERSQSASGGPSVCTSNDALSVDPFEEECVMFNKPCTLEEMDEIGKKRVYSHQNFVGLPCL